MSTETTVNRLRRSVPAWGTAVLLVLLCVAWAGPAAAGDDEFEQEIRAAQERYHALIEEAKELEEAGRFEEAQEHFRKAHELGNRIEQALMRHDRERDREREREREEREHARREREERPRLTIEDVKEILHGLRQGMNALRALRKMDELERLERITAGLERELAQERSREGADAEVEAAKRQVEVMRRALAGLLEGEKRDAAHRLEQAIHALELAIEGRGDAARRV
ncbi:MAG: hypothetical protein ACYTG6_15490, partial [Planctomycetota bacterium]